MNTEDFLRFIKMFLFLSLVYFLKHSYPDPLFFLKASFACRPSDAVGVLLKLYKKHYRLFYDVLESNFHIKIYQ